jgi:hypothetical protein
MPNWIIYLQSLNGVLNLALVVLIVGVWKPWLFGYGGEKGKNLARKEDIDKILAEVKLVTAAQEEIKSKLAGDLWHKQTLWDAKKETYGSLINAIHELSIDYGHLSKILDLKDSPQNSPTAESMITKAFIRQIRTLSRHHAEFTHALSLAVIFLNKECQDALRAYNEVSSTKDSRNMNISEATQEQQLLLTLFTMIMKAARKELGVLST